MSVSLTYVYDQCLEVLSHIRLSVTYFSKLHSLLKNGLPC